MEERNAIIFFFPCVLVVLWLLWAVVGFFLFIMEFCFYIYITRTLPTPRQNRRGFCFRNRVHVFSTLCVVYNTSTQNIYIEKTFAKFLASPISPPPGVLFSLFRESVCMCVNYFLQNKRNRPRYPFSSSFFLSRPRRAIETKLDIHTVWGVSNFLDSI